MKKAETRQQPEEITYNLPGKKIAARYWHGAGLPIVAFHGWLDNADSFTPLAELMGNPVLAVDFPGHGKSSHLAPGMRYHYVELIPVIMGVLQQFTRDKVVLMGHSMGAGAVSLAAAVYPEAVEKLILIEGLGPVTSDHVSITQSLRKAIFDFEQKHQKRPNPYDTFDRAVKARQLAGELDERSAELLCRRNLRKTREGYVWRYDSRLKISSLLRFSEKQVQDLLADIRCPVLLIEATDTLQVLKSHFLERTGFVKNLTHHKIAGGHHVHMQKPAQVLELIENFLGVKNADSKNNS